VKTAPTCAINLLQCVVSDLSVIGKRTLGRTNCVWDRHINMDLKEITGLEVVYWIHLTVDRDPWQAVVIMVTNFQFLEKLVNS
jgi:hypothetical protein